MPERESCGKAHTHDKQNYIFIAHFAWKFWNVDGSFRGNKTVCKGIFLSGGCGAKHDVLD